MNTIDKGDTFSATLNFKHKDGEKKGEPIDISDSTFVVLVKKEGQEDEDALDIQLYELGENEGKDGKLAVKLNGLDERGDFIIYIKSLDGEDKRTIKQIPLTIK